MIRVLILLCLMGCGGSKGMAEDMISQVVYAPTLPDRFIDPALEGLVGAFLLDAAKLSNRLPFLGKLRIVRFADLQPDQAGVCTTHYTFRYSVLYTEVKISNLYKEGLPHTLKGILYHELGHCILRKDHGGSGIMRSIAHYERQYKFNWKRWVKELFTN